MDRQQVVLDILKNLRGLEPLKELFWSQLNYQRINQSIPRQGWTETAAQALAEDPLLFAAGGQDNAFRVIYGRLATDKLPLGLERPVVSKLLRNHPYTLFVFSNSGQDQWHFLNVKYDGQTEKRRLFRRITVGREERLRTASERLTLLDLASLSSDLFGLSPLAIQQRHDEAFDVELVTKQFFEEYKAIFGILQDDLERQTKDRTWAHDYALQFLNRCMFLYFIQRKRWLGDDTEFLKAFWESYNNADQPKDSFFERWLQVLFFEVFNRKFHGGHRHFPPAIQEALALAPFLNGGLFQQNKLDDQHNFAISDSRFGQVLTFLDRYNFTIAEDSPLDKEVAVDPEMIGKVYESLVNVSTDADERGEAGIFYTPRTEIDLMCRLTLVDNLTNHLGAERKDLFYELVFALEPEEKAAADRAVAQAKLWEAIEVRLGEITVLDPACGSGSFLVGMLNIFDNLLERASAHTGTREGAYDRRKRIIGQSLYGVDVMEWACHIAELRLWLALIIDAQFSREELHARRDPLLPHFTFRIRCGDSLVQEIGGISLSHIRAAHHLPPEIKRRVTELKAAKLRFYSNESTSRFRTPDQLENEERRVFAAILDARDHEIQEEMKSLQRKSLGPQEHQIRLDGTVEKKAYQIKLEAVESQQKIEALDGALDRVRGAREVLKRERRVPFVWDIAFVEVFESESKGFDIVIGNPPYVRTQNISNPLMSRDVVTPADRKEYKDKIARSVYQAFPTFFRYSPRLRTAAHRLDAKSDLYIYFYFIGLSLLNKHGSFCFINSNSWLDAEYGADLQEFLLRHWHIKMIIDNQARRSFATADVNTVIVLLSSPEDSQGRSMERTARFVSFKVPFEHVISPIVFEEIESRTQRTLSPEYRVYPVGQATLLQEGIEVTHEAVKVDVRGKPVAQPGPLLKGTYSGNKWGGKYLRAPEVFYTLLGKGGDKLVLLGQICDVNEGKPTGANDFFYPTKDVVEKFRIEERFLHPGLMKTRGANHFVLRAKHLDRFFFAVDASKAELRGTGALRYILYGEELGLNERGTFRNKANWYAFRARKPADLVLPCGIGATFFCSMNAARAIASNSFTELRLHNRNRDSVPIWTWMNSVVGWLYAELMGRSILGGGMLKVDPTDCRRMPLLKSDALPRDLRALDRQVGDVWEEIDAPDRRDLDDAVFDSLRFTRAERDAVYEALRNLVDNRLTKARSLEPETKQKRLRAAEETRGIWLGLPIPAEEEPED